MIKLIALLSLISTLTFAILPLEDSLMYECQNAALALGGYDEHHVNISVNLEEVSVSDLESFKEFAADYLKIKEIKTYGSRETYVVRAADDSLWVDVAMSLETYIALDGISGSCHLDL